MFKNYIKFTIRNLWKNKVFSTLNILGLTIGVTCSLFIYLWIQDELNKDKFHENDQNLYQVMQNFENTKGEIFTASWTPAPLADALQQEIPEVAYSVTVASDYNKEKGIVSNKKKAIQATELYCGYSFFDVFSFSLIDGKIDQPFNNSKGILISDELAIKLFHTTRNLVGKRLTWNKGEYKNTFLISGIFEKPSSASSMQFDILLSTNLYINQNPDTKDWNYNGPNTFVVLKKGSSKSSINQKLKGYLQKKGRKEKHTLFLSKYSDQYLYGTYTNGIQAGGRVIYVYLFSILAIFTLVIACINFMNLSTAQASRRMKEIGVKKVVGVSRRSLVLQFLGESIALTILAMFVALLLVELLIPQFNTLTAKQLHLSLTPFFIVSLLGTTLLIGLLSGSYPSLYLSKFDPIKILKGNLQTPRKALNIRRGLVVFQFTISVLLITCALVVYAQIQFIQSKSLGYDRDHVILFKRDGKLKKDLKAFLGELKKLPGVVNASSFQNSMFENTTGTRVLTWEGLETDNEIKFKSLFFDYDMIETLGIEMQAGRAFSKDYGADASKIIFNETAIKAMGLKDPIGKTITLTHQPRQIVGVVKDFHYESFYEELKPCFIQLNSEGENIAVKIQSGREKKTVAVISQLYEEFNQGFSFEYTYLDQQYQQFYAAEQRVSVLSQYFAGFAVLISCLGLFGLVAFTLERKLKEIGIRKVLGSSNLNIIYLLTGEYGKMVLIFIFIGTLISFFMLKEWLDGFVYRIELGLGYFAIASLLVLFIAFLTVGIQTFKAAMMNPVDILKDE